MLEELIPLFVFAACFIFLIVKFYKKSGTLYLDIIVAAIGCLFLERLYKVIYIFSFDSLPSGFYLGYLGMFGCFLFLTSSNFGVIDHIMDDGSKGLGKYRIISLIAPVIVCGITFLSVSYAQDIMTKIFCVLLAIPIALASYFSLKQILFPDQEFLFLKLIKPCNFVALIMAILACFDIYTRMTGNDSYNQIIEYLMCVACLALTYFVERGHQKWEI